MPRWPGLLMTGEAGAGKDQLAHACGKTFCDRREADHYIRATSVDPLGDMSSCNLLQEAGLVFLTDFDFVTQKGEKLTANEIKNLFDATISGQIRARRYCVRFGKRQPRNFALNGTKDEMASFFHSIGLSSLGYLIQANYPKP